MGNWARSVAILVGIGGIAGSVIAAGIAWGMQRADVHHLSSAVSAMAIDITEMRKDMATAMVAIGKIEGRLRSSNPWGGHSLMSNKAEGQEGEE